MLVEIINFRLLHVTLWYRGSLWAVKSIESLYGIRLFWSLFNGKFEAKSREILCYAVKDIENNKLVPYEDPTVVCLQ